MSQWGLPQSFVEGSNGIRVIPHVTTTGFARATRKSPIDDLMLMHVDGDTGAALAMLDRLKERFVGQPYSVWLADIEE